MVDRPEVGDDRITTRPVDRLCTPRGRWDDCVRDPRPFAVASRPEVVSLAGGMPWLDALPMEAIADTVQRLLLTRGSVALQYGNGQGDQSCASRS